MAEDEAPETESATSTISDSDMTKLLVYGMIAVGAAMLLLMLWYNRGGGGGGGWDQDEYGPPPPQGPQMQIPLDSDQDFQQELISVGGGQ